MLLLLLFAFDEIDEKSQKAQKNLTWEGVYGKL